MLGEKTVELKGMIGAIGVKQVHAGVGVFEVHKIARPHEGIIIGAGIEIDPEGLLETEITEDLHFRALSSAGTKHNGIPRYELAESPEPTIKFQTKTQYLAAREAAPAAQQFGQLLLLVREVFIVRAVLAKDEPIGIELPAPAGSLIELFSEGVPVASPLVARVGRLLNQRRARQKVRREVVHGSLECEDEVARKIEKQSKARFHHINREICRNA